MRKIIIALLLLFLLSGAALGVSVDELIGRQADALGVDQLEQSLPDSARQLLNGTDLGQNADFDAGLRQVLQAVFGQLGGVFRQAARSAAIVMVVAILAGLLSSVYAGEEGAVPNYIPLMGALAVSAVAVGTGSAFIGLGAQTLQEVDNFSATLLPSMAAAGAMSGGFTSSAVKYAGTVLFLDILMTLTNRIIMPLIYAYIAASIGRAALGGDALKAAANLLKWITGTLITTVMITFVGYLTITGVVSGSADVVTTRVARTAIGATLPVVGRIVADAGEMVLAGAAMVRNGIGVVGLLAVLAICLVPLLQLGAHYLMFKAAAGLSGPITDSRIGELISNLGTAFGMVMGLTGAAAMMLFFSIISMMRMVIR